MLNSSNLGISLISGLFGALLAVGFQSHLDELADELATKRDVLRRFAGNRYVLTENSGATIQLNGEPFVALNEAFIVFAEDPTVIEALRVMHDQLGQQGRLVDNIVTVVKEMAKVSNVAINLNDSFIERPFTPRRE